MPALIVVNTPANWPFHIPGVQVVGARAYLTDPAFSGMEAAKVFNCCRTYAYQSLGYYVSLLATARGHKVMPGIGTIQDLKSHAILRVASEDLDAEIQEELKPLLCTEFQLSIYFGRNIARRYDRLALRLFNQFQAPLLRAFFARDSAQSNWVLSDIRPIPANEVPDAHRDFVAEAATDFFARRRAPGRRRSSARYDLAILVNPEEKEPPSDERALRKFAKAAAALDMRAERIDKDDYARIAEYDALFIRETTAVNHHTYRFAQRAAAEGLVVVDDPESIVRCTNKVFLAETLARHGVAAPRTVIVHRENVEGIGATLGYPLVLKRPDSSFSLGVLKVENEEALAAAAETFFERSELFVAQEFLPTTFDWRVGVFDHQPLYVCKYHMADSHWQIIHWQGDGGKKYGRVETLPVEAAPRNVVRTALRAARLFGDGLYGVDLKQVGKKVYLMEVNENPNIDSGYEDAFLKDELYWRIMWVFLKRIEALKQGRRPS
jgi:glutathione synthase/RimK-type ligase-like ATP-grasp enzyme